MCRPESGCERTNLTRCDEWANEGACDHDSEYMLNCCKYACFDECVWDYRGIFFTGAKQILPFENRVLQHIHIGPAFRRECVI